MARSRRFDRLAVARTAVDVLIPMIQKMGTWVAADESMPRHCRLTVAGLDLIYTPEAKTLPWAQTVPLLDACLQGGPKVLSVQISPLEVISFKGGDWVETLANMSPSRTLM